MDGFTYKGIHCSTYGVEYAPSASDRWWDSPEFEIYKKDIPWGNRGYYYGNSVEIREIKLECYFEGITIAQREQIRKWLGRDTSGALVFDERPFVYYNVRPGNIVPGKLYCDNDKYSGTMTITFIAVEPFGYLTRKSNAGTEDDNAEDYCPIIDTADMPAAPTISSTGFNVYNPGTEVCGLSIKLSGSASNPIRFFNSTNKTQCVFSSLPANGLIVDIDGDTGFVKTYAGLTPNTYENGFAYHDHGVVRLESGLNTISIEEQNAQGNWVTPSTLSLESIIIDYKPRLL